MLIVRRVTLLFLSPSLCVSSFLSLSNYHSLFFSLNLTPQLAHPISTDITHTQRRFTGFFDRPVSSRSLTPFSCLSLSPSLLCHSYSSFIKAVLVIRATIPARLTEIRAIKATLLLCPIRTALPSLFSQSVSLSPPLPPKTLQDGKLCPTKLSYTHTETDPSCCSPGHRLQTLPRGGSSGISPFSIFHCHCHLPEAFLSAHKICGIYKIFIVTTFFMLSGQEGEGSERGGGAGSSGLRAVNLMCSQQE